MWLCCDPQHLQFQDYFLRLSLWTINVFFPNLQPHMPRLTHKKNLQPEEFVLKKSSISASLLCAPIYLHILCSPNVYLTCPLNKWVSKWISFYFCLLSKSHSEMFKVEISEIISSNPVIYYKLEYRSLEKEGFN